MINYLNFNIDLKKDMYDCFSSNVGDFYKQLSYEEFCNNLFNHYEFDENGVFVAVEDNKVIGFICSFVRHIEKDNDDKYSQEIIPRCYVARCRRGGETHRRRL